MAAFVSNYRVVATINNFVPKTEVVNYTKIQGNQTEPYLPPLLLDSFHRFVIQINAHPVRIALNIQKIPMFSEHLSNIRKVLSLMSEREFLKRSDSSEVASFKYHYLGWIVQEIIKCKEYFQARSNQDTSSGESNFIELFVKRVLKDITNWQRGYMGITIRECVREFPYRECTIFRQVVVQMANIQETSSCLDVIKTAINGQRGFQDDITYCSACDEEKPDKKCSKCKEVQYCDRECQRLHWFKHKKACSRPQTTTATQSTTNTTATTGNNGPIDSKELSDELKQFLVDE